MRVTLITSSLTAGGAERVIIQLASHWVDRGADVTLVTLDAAPPYYAVDDRVVLRQLNLPTDSKPLFRALSTSARRVLALRGLIRTSQSNIVISFLGKINVLTLLATRGMKVPVIVSERNNPEKQVFRPTWRWLRNRLYCLADCVVTPSQGILDWFPNAIRARALVIPNPVDLSASRCASQFPKPALVAAGRLVSQKGFDLLLQAFGKIAKDFPEWSLIIRGEGEKRSELEKLRDTLGLQERVQMPGTTEKPGEWVGEGDVFVLSSRYEGFGNVVTEAMVAGLPIVSFDCPWGPGEILTDGIDGILVPPEDVDALAEAMARLISDVELRRRLGEAAKRSVERFDSKRIMTRWDALAAELMAPRALRQSSPSS